MKSFHTLLFWIYYLTCLVLVEAKGSLRGRSAIDSQHKNTKVEVLPGRLKKRELNVIGIDDRSVFTDPLGYPLSAVGKVLTAKGECTGVMVDPSLMLTAQSCVNQLSDPLKFIPAYHDSSSVHGSANSERVTYDKDIMPSNATMSYHDAAFNYMVVELDQPLGDVVGYWNATVYDRAWNGQPHWAHIGYTNDIADGERPIVVTNNSAIEEVHSYFTSDGDESYLMSTSIDFGNGQMGGPVFGFFTDSNNSTSIQIVGIMSGASTSGDVN